MKKFLVKIEGRGFSWDIEVEAESLSDAVKVAQAQHCAPRQVEVTPRPTWVEPIPAGSDKEDICELSYEVQDTCVDCGLHLFHQRTEEQQDWPWVSSTADEQCTQSVCYPCAKKREEAGNVCYYYHHHYRDPHHYGCDKCPIGECPKAQNRYYDNLKQRLRRAILLSNAKTQGSDQSIQELLDANEFGLAVEGLRTCGAHDKRDPRFAANMKQAEEMMAKGWKNLT